MNRHRFRSRTLRDREGQDEGRADASLILPVELGAIRSWFRACEQRRKAIAFLGRKLKNRAYRERSKRGQRLALQRLPGTSVPRPKCKLALNSTLFNAIERPRRLAPSTTLRSSSRRPRTTASAERHAARARRFEEALARAEADLAELGNGKLVAVYGSSGLRCYASVSAARMFARQDRDLQFRAAFGFGRRARPRADVQEKVNTERLDGRAWDEALAHAKIVPARPETSHLSLFARLARDAELDGLPALAAALRKGADGESVHGLTPVERSWLAEIMPLGVEQVSS